MRMFVLFGLAACGAKVAEPSAPAAPPPMVCGGIAAIQCPLGTACADDTRDDCDPSAGGADCSGLCTACDAIPGRRTISADPEQCKAMKFACEDGEVAWFDGCGCGCAAP
jgi:hypothetical protein